jgi:hypothetical protein
MAAALAGLDRARQLDRTRKQQQFFSECRLAGVRVGNDAKGATAGNFAGDQLAGCVARCRYGIVAWQIGNG